MQETHSGVLSRRSSAFVQPVCVHRKNEDEDLNSVILQRQFLMSVKNQKKKRRRRKKWLRKMNQYLCC